MRGISNIANSTEFKTTVENRQGVVPDGINSSTKITIDPTGKKTGIEIFPNASWYEMKATSGVIYPSSFSNQAKGLVNALWIANPKAAKENVASLTFVTTYDATLSAKLVNDAKRQYNIRVRQIVAYYRETDVGYQVTYGSKIMGIFIPLSKYRDYVYL